MIFIAWFNGDVSHTRRYAERRIGMRVQSVTSNCHQAAPERVAEIYQKDEHGMK